MDRYQITAEPDGTFSAKVIYPDGHVETATGFLTRSAALQWVGERIIVDKDTDP